MSVTEFAGKVMTAWPLSLTPRLGKSNASTGTAPTCSPWTPSRYVWPFTPDEQT